MDHPLLITSPRREWGGRTIIEDVITRAGQQIVFQSHKSFQDLKYFPVPNCDCEVKISDISAWVNQNVLILIIFRKVWFDFDLFIF